MLYDRCEGLSDNAVHGHCEGYKKELRSFVADSWSLAIGEEIHYRIVDDCIGADFAKARVPLEELDVGNEYSMPVSASKEAVAVGHVDQ